MCLSDSSTCLIESNVITMAENAWLCVDSCEKSAYLSSDARICVDDCAMIFEVVDEAADSNRCRRCDSIDNLTSSSSESSDN